MGIKNIQNPISWPISKLKNDYQKEYLPGKIIGLTSINGPKIGLNQVQNLHPNNNNINNTNITTTNRKKFAAAIAVNFKKRKEKKG